MHGQTAGHAAEGPGPAHLSNPIQPSWVKALTGSEGRLPPVVSGTLAAAAAANNCPPGQGPTLREGTGSRQPPPRPDPTWLAPHPQKHSPTGPSPCTLQHGVARSVLRAAES